MDRATAVKIQKELEAAALAVFEKHGLNLKTLNCKYSDVELNFSIKTALKDKPADVVARENETANIMLGMYGLETGITFNMGGKKYEIVGFNSRKSKNQISLKGSDGKTYMCSVDAAKAYIAHSAKA